MPILGFFIGLLVFTLITMIFQPIGAEIDRQKRRVEQIGTVNFDTIDEEMAKPFTERFLIPLFRNILKAISGIVPKTPKNSKDITRSKLEKDLMLAGIRLTTGEFNAIKMIVSVTCIVISLLPLASRSMEPIGKLLLFFIGLIAAILIPRYYLKSSIKKRQGSIRKDLPDMLDLISVNVEAGLGFDFALLRVVKRTKGALTDEFRTVYREIQMGRPRREALKNMGERNDVEELKTFVSSVVQADQLGFSIKTVLRAQAAQLRLTRKQRAEEKALKAPVKMILPLVIFIFPVIFIILLGPSVIEIAKTFGGGGAAG